jgi:hypothetical protein
MEMKDLPDGVSNLDASRELWMREKTTPKQTPNA